MIADRLLGRMHRAFSPLLAFALVAVVASCQGHATVAADCDQLLNEEKYAQVIDDCDNPVDRASAYLGLGGFDMFLLVDDAAADGKVALMLGLTAANIDERRGYFNLATEEVNPPQGASQAFALLLSGFLGLAVTTAQYLDNGIGETALNDVYDGTEVAGAVTVGASGGFGLTVRDSPDLYAVRYNGKSYIFDCSSATSPCGDGGTQPLVYDDPAGTGILDTTPGESGDKAAVLADLGNITSAGRIVQLVDADIGFTLSPATEEPTKSYLGREPAPVTYNMGMSTYLTAINRAKDELESSTGSTGGSDVTDQIDAITTTLDNGGDCSGAPTTTVLQLGYLYLAAVGTISRPAPSNYSGSNLLAVTDATDLDSIPTVPFPVIAGGDTDFTVDYYKLIFATTNLGAFDLTFATPRVDEAFSTFQNNFENLWLFSPGASPEADNQVNVAEVLCSSD